MSRIYEALQKAEMGRDSRLESIGAQLAADAAIFSRPESQESRGEFDLQQVVRRPWQPAQLSLPSLAMRGANVEQFRGLRSRIEMFRLQAPLKTILVSSGMPEEGKTFVAANLALSIARNAAHNVLLIDGDLRRGTLYQLLGAPASPGLAEYLAGSAELAAIMQSPLPPENDNAAIARDISNVAFIPAGACSDNSSELVSSRRMETLLASVSTHFDWIVIDSPPVLAVTDAVEMARLTDAIVLVARDAMTRLEVAQRTVAAFSNSHILGFVLNAARNVPHADSYAHYYGQPS